MGNSQASRQAILDKSPDVAKGSIQANSETPTPTLKGEFGLAASMLGLAGATSAKVNPDVKVGGTPNTQKPGLAKRVGHTLATKGKIGLVGGLAGGALMAPATYMSNKAADKYKGDENFKASHFAAIAAPAAVASTIGTGMMTNATRSMAKGQKTGIKKMVKNIVSPKRNMRFAKHEMKTIGKTFTRKGFKGGILSLGLAGLGAMAPISYAKRTLSKKKDQEGESKNV